MVLFVVIDGIWLEFGSIWKFGIFVCVKDRLCVLFVIRNLYLRGVISYFRFYFIFSWRYVKVTFSLMNSNICFFNFEKRLLYEGG